ERLKDATAHELVTAVGCEVAQVAAPTIRVREGIAAHYGVPLEPRQLRLVQRLDGLERNPPSSRNEIQALPQPPSVVTSNLSSGVSQPPAAAPVQRPITGVPPRHEPTTLEMERVVGPYASEPPQALDDGWGLVDELSTSGSGELPELAGPPTDMPAPPSPDDLVAPTPEADPAAFEDSPRPPGMVDRRAALGFLKREVRAARAPKTRARTARKKGPFARLDAERELERASSPDDVLDTLFAFGSQFFEYAALFVIVGDLAEGRDAFGPGADFSRVQGIGVPLDLPSSLATARTEGHVSLSRFDHDDLDRDLVRDLGRASDRPRLRALLPLTVKRRAVAVLYGDDGSSDVNLASLGDLLGFTALASSQLERLVMLRKSKKGRFSGLVAPRAQPGSVAALARALALPIPEPTLTMTGGDGPPPARISVEIAAPRGGTLPGVALELEAHAAAPPASRASERDQAEDEPAAAVRVSPGAASVAPPAASRPETTKPYDDSLLTPSPAAPVTAPRVATVEPAAPEAARAVDPLAHTVLGAPEGSFIRRSEPPGPYESPSPEAAVAASPVVGERASRPSVETAPVRSHRPLPREEDADASMLIATEGGASWSEPPPRAGSAHDPRAGAYHIVPRPAEARRTEEVLDVDRLLERALVGGLEGEEAMSELLREAEIGFPRLVERFPGPLRVDRFKARSDIPPASDCGPLLKLLVMMRRSALPFMTVRSASQDVEQRFWATHTLGELLFPESSNAVLPRLFDDDVSVRRVARRAAQALVSGGGPGEPLKQSLDHTMKSAEEPVQRRLLAIEALSEIRVPSVVPLLIGVLRDRSDTIAEAARTALMLVTRQDLGRSSEVWTAWWEQHKHEHRVEWLIQALTHDMPSIRRAAGDELKLVTREYFGYYDDLPAREREKAQAAYRQWWIEEGQYRFR
ncbi:MAG TPA: hypothetical protein VL400_01450, partial [Polyangiaceae bacterium]|nr:hypothetical protein [Polyangiaceae bacterium]